MVKIITTAKNPSESEKESLLVVAKVFDKNKWTIVLRDPSGSKGATGGNTSDIAIYPTDSDDYEQDSTITKTIDVYTPKKTTQAKDIADNVRKKLSNQTDIVCLDLENHNQKIDSIINKVQSTLKKHKMNNQKVITHNKGKDIMIIFSKKQEQFN